MVEYLRDYDVYVILIFGVLLGFVQEPSLGTFLLGSLDFGIRSDLNLC